MQKNVYKSLLCLLLLSSGRIFAANHAPDEIMTQERFFDEIRHRLNRGELTAAQANREHKIKKLPLNMSLLSYSIRAQQHDITEQLLELDDIDLSHQDDFGNTPLMNSVIDRDKKTTQAILKIGKASVNILTKKRGTPLVEAILDGELGTARLLLPHCNEAVLNRSLKFVQPFGIPSGGGINLVSVASHKRGAELILAEMRRRNIAPLVDRDQEEKVLAKNEAGGHASSAAEASLIADLQKQSINAYDRVAYDPVEKLKKKKKNKKKKNKPKELA